ncbi:MAG: ATP phosphoribosyltransferase [Planctomyces sp.]|nr:ATP phosphoribosyltransferase [Planctomyces sp.]MBA4119930.1 ATP phosphoribosyltransferase [Isosphaera sp.]
MNEPRPLLHMALPKGRMHDQIVRLLADAGIRVSTDARGYRPRVSLPGVEAKILKPQAIVEMLALGTRDVGFAGSDWVAEMRADLVEVLDTGMDAVQVVVAAPESLAPGGRLPDRPLRVASELSRLTEAWIARRGRGDRFVRSWGATEVLPPEDADCIVDISASGETLRANKLAVVDVIMSSSTRLYASRAAAADPAKRARIDDLAMLLRSVIDARGRVMLELNVSGERLAQVTEVLPCMKEPTLSPLHHGAGFAVKAAVPRESLAELIPRLRARGGTDIVISPIAQVVP